MSRLAVVSEASTGGDRVWLDNLGDIRALRFSTDVAGDLTASWSMTLDPKTDHRALWPGRRVKIPGVGWSGTMDAPQRGDPWTFQANGWPDDAKRYVATASITGNALILDEIVDRAISDGIGWTRPSALPTLTAGQQNSGSMTVGEALTQVCAAKGKYWSVSRAGAVTAATLPGTVSYLLFAQDTAGGRQLRDFVTDVQVGYVSSSTYNFALTERSATSRPFGTMQAFLDKTPLGYVGLAQAQEAGDNYLAKHGARLRFTGAFTVTDGQLTNPGGSGVDLAFVTAAGGPSVRVTVTDPDTAAGEFALGAVKLNIGQTDYDVDSGVLTLTPLDVKQRGLGAMVGVR